MSDPAPSPAPAAFLRHFILGTAGHVDHGKSALVKALTGIDPDRLPEEKARGITIDLGFAHMDIPSGRDSQVRYRLGIVDVPGHEDFVKNMVAGVGCLDLVLLVVAADDGWMRQTEEHLEILGYLGIRRAVVALSKADLSQGDVVLRIAAVRERLAGTPLASAPIVATSVVSGVGLDELRATLAAVLDDLPAPPDLGKPRLAVDRAFKLQGFGTVITGTVTGGTFAVGQSVVLQPSGANTRVRSLQSYHQEAPVVGPGMRAALNLADLPLADAVRSAQGVRRGDVVTLPGLGVPSACLDVVLWRSPRTRSGGGTEARALRNDLRVRVHLGTSHVTGRICLRGDAPLEVGASGLAQLRLDAPCFAFDGDRFILRDWGDQTTLAGGMVLDPTPRKGWFHRPAQVQFLEARRSASEDVGGAILSLVQRDRAVAVSGLLKQSRFSEAQVNSALAALGAEARVRRVGECVLDPTAWSTWAEFAVTGIRAFHQRAPERWGMPLADLKSELGRQLPRAELFPYLVQELLALGFVQSGSIIRHASHRPALPAQLAAPCARLRARLSAKPLEPPSRKELIQDSLAQSALRYLLDLGEVVELDAELVLLADAFHQAAERIRQHLSQRQMATVSELRQRLGTTRRVLVPLLERLDRDGLTVRRGDHRVLRAGG